jgi:hypothetical protein
MGRVCLVFDAFLGVWFPVRRIDCDPLHTLIQAEFRRTGSGSYEALAAAQRLSTSKVPARSHERIIFIPA